VSEPKVRQAKVSDLTPDDRNANKGTERGLKALDHSLRQYGAGRSILLDKAGRIIAGNKTTQGAADIGLEDVIIVQTDGTKLVAVQRTDLDLNDKKARELALWDNRVGELDLAWDIDELLASVADGVDLSAMFRQDELDALLQAANAPDFQPVGIDEQGRLDEKKQVQCPHCDMWFTPK
jgi:ParB-like chromosome segregation protein Spo0J